MKQVFHWIFFLAIFFLFWNGKFFYAQSIINGVVLENGMPAVDAILYVKGFKNQAVSSDTEGLFTLPIPDKALQKEIITCIVISQVSKIKQDWSFHKDSTKFVRLELKDFERKSKKSKSEYLSNIDAKLESRKTKKQEERRLTMMRKDSIKKANESDKNNSEEKKNNKELSQAEKLKIENIKKNQNKELLLAENKRKNDSIQRLLREKDKTDIQPVKPRTEIEEKTFQKKSDIYKTLAFVRFDSILIKLKRQETWILKENKAINEEINFITNQLTNSSELTVDEKAKLRAKIVLLENQMRANDLLYQKLTYQTRQELEKLKNLTGLQENFLRRNQSYLFIATLIGCLFALMAFWLYIISRKRRKQRDYLTELVKQIEVQKAQISIEKENSEKLLLNILPEEIAQELKVNGKTSTKHYEMVSVLFTDFQGFTAAASKISPEVLVNKLNTYFAAFDEIIEKYDLEKIKTIGDAYMCAGGIPVANRSNPIDMVLAGLELQRFVQHNSSENDWKLRLGINTGEVIAGVIGQKKYAYDLWGDTVNIASRMESNGEIDKVNISENTYHLVKNLFECEYRGKINAKGKGEIDMYFVKGIKSEFSENGEGILPNDLFFKSEFYLSTKF